MAVVRRRRRWRGRVEGMGKKGVEDAGYEGVTGADGAGKERQTVQLSY